MVTSTLNNLHADWCKRNNKERADPYAFVCMSAQGRDGLADFRSEDDHHIIASTVELLTTGVDIPAVRGIAFFRYVKSPIQLQQMIGRGARIDTSRGKLSFAVYDYTNATDALDKDWHPRKPQDGVSGEDSGNPPPTIATIDGLEVVVTPGDNYIIITDENGRQIRLNAEQYRIRMAQRVLKKVQTLNLFREIWATPAERRALLESLRDKQVSPDALAALSDRPEHDGYDIIAETVYGALAMTRKDRAQAFGYKNEEWLSRYPAQAQNVLIALAERFAESGIQELEAGAVFDTPAVRQAGGVEALYKTGEEPYELLREAKRRLFAA